MTGMHSSTTSPPPRDAKVLIVQAVPQGLFLDKGPTSDGRQGKFLGPRRPLATQRLQKQNLHEIPPSPPVHLASLNIFDTMGHLIEHPLQLSHKPAQLTEDGGGKPLKSPARSTVSDRGGLPGAGLGFDQGSSHPAPGRPPHTFIKRHDSQSSGNSHTSSSGKSRALSTSSSPLAGSPMSPFPLTSGALSPLSPTQPSITGRKKGSTMLEEHHAIA